MAQEQVDETKKTEDAAADAVKSEEPAGKRKVSRKDLPSVGYLLAHGDPATAHLPKTWGQIWGFPLVVAIVFFISLLTFHYAPHHKSTRRGFKLPKAPVKIPVDPSSLKKDKEL